MSSVICGFDATKVGGVDQASELLVYTGPTLVVHIGFDATCDPQSENPPKLPDVEYHALIDTGASTGAIDSKLAQLLKLPVVDQVNVGGIGGMHTVNMYMAQVLIPSLKCVLYGGFTGVHLADAGCSQQALIGRDFLKNFAMHYEGRTGTVVLTNDIDVHPNDPNLRGLRPSKQD